jgi:3-phosphoshikimate 1-carboxyvinyltransferase
MNLKIHNPVNPISGTISLTGSKSISNRALIIRALLGLQVQLKNISDSDDTLYLEKALLQIHHSDSAEIHVGHAGTNMRFLTALLSIKKGKWVITGSERIQQRPIKELVEVLKKLGADISYAQKQGHLPLQINGMDLEGGEVSINGNISSQFISALLLISPNFKNGLKLNIVSEIVSKSYIDMTIKIMQDFGASVFWEGNVITVNPISYSYHNPDYTIEGDWSSASYYYSLIALSKGPVKLELLNLFDNSVQADAICNHIFSRLGVQTTFLNTGVELSNINHHQLPNQFSYNFNNCPDIAQTLVCTCIGLGISFYFTGLSTLKIKETDRILALKEQFKKWGISLAITDDSITYDNSQACSGQKEKIIETYEDHRMAMSFAPLCLQQDIIIANSGVVSKSYPNFWEDLKSIGIKIEFSDTKNLS